MNYARTFIIVLLAAVNVGLLLQLSDSHKQGRKLYDMGVETGKAQAQHELSAQLEAQGRQLEEQANQLKDQTSTLNAANEQMVSAEGTLDATADQLVKTTDALRRCRHLPPVLWELDYKANRPAGEGGK